MVSYLIVSIVLIFAVGYIVYGKFLSDKFDINNTNPTPAHSLKDNIDFVPSHKLILFGHHFSSIAGAGPIVGPIIAGLAFGWLPVVLWIVIGSIFIGGVHDFSSLIASIRHKSKSVAEVAKENISKDYYRIFLVFIWFALVYVLVAFIDLTAETFVQEGAVATASIFYIFLAVLFGICLYKLRLKLWYLTIIFVTLVFLGIWIGQIFPINALPVTIINNAKTWSIGLIFYCFIASVLPVGLLLQPRDYLSSFLLYGSILVSLFGIVLGVGQYRIEYPVFTSWNTNIGGIFPILFITVACGAISGFHSLVSSGTTAKQLNKETDARTIGYGGMLVEGIVAIIAISTVMIIKSGSDLTGKPPLVIYATGMGRFANTFGISEKIGFSFGLLALSTFILTTLDTVTRIGRYVFQEFFNLLDKPNTRYTATLITLILPLLFIFLSIKDKAGNIIPVWKAVWPVFGATNQLLGALALLVVSIWLKNKGKNIVFIIIPTIFMFVITLWALCLLILQYRFSIIGTISSLLFILAIYLIVKSSKKLLRKYRDGSDSFVINQQWRR